MGQISPRFSKCQFFASFAYFLPKRYAAKNAAMRTGIRRCPARLTTYQAHIAPRLSREKPGYAEKNAAPPATGGAAGEDKGKPHKRFRPTGTAQDKGKQTLRLDKVNQVLALFGKEMGPVDAPRILD